MSLLAADLLRPWALAALLPLAALAWLLARRTRGFRSRLAFGLRCLALLALVLALARPRLFRKVDDLAVAFVLDVSESVPRDARDRTLHPFGEWVQALEGRDLASVIIFAEKPSVEVPFTGAGGRGDAAVGAGAEGLESRVVPSQSDLAGALRFAEGTFPPGHARRIVLASDG